MDTGGHAKEAGGAGRDHGRNRITCALIGHSRIVTYCFGYVSARCGDQIGDTLGGMTSLENSVVVGHACDICRANYEKLGLAGQAVCR